MSTPLGALDRGLAILDYLASAREASATEIAGALTLSRSTTYRLIDRLDQAGLGVFSADEMIFVYRERGPQPVTLNAEVGARRPLHCTAVGKAYLAALPPGDSIRNMCQNMPLEEPMPFFRRVGTR